MIANPPLAILERKRQESKLHPLIEPHLFSPVVNKMRLFFLQKGFLEVHTQNRLSIMAACEDPKTIASYNYLGQVWPLPQTGQMWLEYELLGQPDVPGFFCVSTSYRNEPDPIPGRHCSIFPMFEFELPGGIDALIQVEAELLEYLGFGAAAQFPQGSYQAMAEAYQVQELDRAEETQIGVDHGPVFFLKDFPEYTNPFWNMKRKETDTSLSEKVDVLLHGMETIGSAERSCNPEEMKATFYSIEEGQYAQRLFDLFGKERVEAELEEFLALDFFPRSGGGIGVTRMIRAMQLSGLIEQ
ncbi:MAG: amino acid--tRNA ligase-related protein [Aureispira sp.]